MRDHDFGPKRRPGAAAMTALVGFLYLLLRDEVVPGAVERILRDVENARGKSVTYSNKHLHRYAREIAARLSKED